MRQMLKSIKINVVVKALQGFLACTFILSSIVFAQKHTIEFENLTIDDGLSQSTITTIIEDRYGFMWFGTQDGLNRYDGYSFRVYRNDKNDSTSVAGNYFTSFYKDHAGNIWLGDTEGNINRYDYSTDSFLSSQLDSNFQNNVINAITEDENGKFYIGTRYGLYVYDPKSRNFEHYQIDPLGDRDNAISALKIDKHNNIWVGTVFKGLYWFDRESKSFKRILISTYGEEWVNKGSIRDIYEDSKGNIWIATWGYGALQYNPADKSLHQYSRGEDDEKSLSSTHVSSIVEDKNGKFWIGTYNGFNLLDLNTGVVNKFFSNIYQKISLADNKVIRLYKDSLGNLWIGTDKGLSKIEKYRKQFYNLRSDQVEIDSELRRGMWSVASDEEDNIWLGNNDGALIKLAPDGSSEIKYFTDLVNPGEEKRPIEGLIRRILFDTNGIQWLGTNGSGLIAVDRETEIYKTYTYDPDDEQSLSTNSITALFEDSEGILWIGTINRGLNRLIGVDDKFQRYKPEAGNESSLSNQGITDIVEDSKGFIWIATAYGLNRYDKDSGAFTRYLQSNSGIISNRITSLYHDQNDHLWIGTVIGLNSIDLKTYEFDSYTKKEGLASDLINSILSDDEGNIWVSTNYGISKIDPKTRSITNYDAFDGLQSNEFNMGAALRSKNGELYFGGVNGVTKFHPDNIKVNPHVPNIVITSFRIFEEECPIINKTEIELSYEENFVSLEFAALDFTNPTKNQFAYKLEGVDPDWIYSGNRHFASYQNLSPGDYVFTVKGTNNDGIWNEVGTSLKIIIIPPWWQTTWFKVLMWLSILVSVLLLHRFRVWRIKAQKLQLEKLVSDKTKELNSKKESAELARKTIEQQSNEILALDKMKSRFFANISHEFRTPLTLIIGPMEEMLERSNSFKTKRTIQIMLRNGRRLLRLVNQLLDLSKLESGRVDLNPSPGDMTGFIRNIVVSFSALAEVRHILLEFDGNEPIYAYFDKNSIEKILLNLIFNAFKYTPDYGEIFVHLDRRPDKLNSEYPENILVSIKDTGGGIGAEQKDHIFERFYQAEESNIWNSEGSGIGLSLCKELVELHNGKIGVKSKLKVGSEFWFKIPLKPVEEEEIEETKRKVLSENDLESIQLYEILERENLIEEENANLFLNSNNVERPIVLIIEDNADLRNYLADNLSKIYKIIVSSDGREGIESAYNSIPDLIVSDIMMPNVDGFELCTTLKQDERTSHIPIILLTARSDDEDKFRGLEYGADEYFLKPFNMKELKVRIKNLIEQRERIRLQYNKDSVLTVGSITESSVDKIFLEKSLLLVEKNISDPNFGVKELANVLSMSRKQLHRKLRALINISPNRYIRKIKLNRAKQLLIQKVGNITEIAYKVGFSSSSYFTKCYKEEFDKVPSESENL